MALNRLKRMPYLSLQHNDSETEKPKIESRMEYILLLFNILYILFLLKPLKAQLGREKERENLNVSFLLNISHLLPALYFCFPFNFIYIYIYFWNLGIWIPAIRFILFVFQVSKFPLNHEEMINYCPPKPGHWLAKHQEGHFLQPKSLYRQSSAYDYSWGPNLCCRARQLLSELYNRETKLHEVSWVWAIPPSNLLLPTVHCAKLWLALPKASHERASLQRL